MTQAVLFDQGSFAPGPRNRGLLKWIGNKQTVARQIVALLPREYGKYFEPFVGSGAVLATLAPEAALASDTFKPLVEIWQTLRSKPGLLKRWYEERWREVAAGDKVEQYERIKARYNSDPNGADLLFLCRACYGGVVRFRKRDGYMSTPCGAHTPISPDSFARRVDYWHARTHGTDFELLDYREAMSRAREGDLVYCDPPYAHSQSILYGAQAFRLEELLDQIAQCKARGVRVALSIDGAKKSGATQCDLPIPQGLFKREIMIELGRSMLRRFQMGGQTLEKEHVSDRLLLTF